MPEFNAEMMKNDSLVKGDDEKYIVFKIFMKQGDILAGEFYFNKTLKRIEKVVYYYQKTGDDYVHHTTMNYKYSSFKTEDFKWTKNDFVKEVENKIYPSSRYVGFEVVNLVN